MALFGKIIAILIIGGLALTLMRRYIFLLLGIVLLLWLIRTIADIYWWYKDKEE